MLERHAAQIAHVCERLIAQYFKLSNTTEWATMNHFHKCQTGGSGSMLYLACMLIDHIHQLASKILAKDILCAKKCHILSFRFISVVIQFLKSSRGREAG